MLRTQAASVFLLETSGNFPSVLQGPKILSSIASVGLILGLAGPQRSFRAVAKIRLAMAEAVRVEHPIHSWLRDHPRARRPRGLQHGPSRSHHQNVTVSRRYDDPLLTGHRTGARLTSRAGSPLSLGGHPQVRRWHVACWLRGAVPPPYQAASSRATVNG